MFNTWNGRINLHTWYQSLLQKCYVLFWMIVFHIRWVELSWDEANRSRRVDPSFFCVVRVLNSCPVCRLDVSYVDVSLTYHQFHMHSARLVLNLTIDWPKFLLVTNYSFHRHNVCNRNLWLSVWLLFFFRFRKNSIACIHTMVLAFRIFFHA